MEWKYVKKLSSQSLIDRYETAYHFRFPETYRKCISVNNGGRPDKRRFITQNNNEYVLKSFLSFNMEDQETIWKITDWNKEELTDQYIPFAIDNFGNLICFQKSNSAIVFIQLEDISLEFISETFDKFIISLYE